MPKAKRSIDSRPSDNKAMKIARYSDDRYEFRPSHNMSQSQDKHHKAVKDLELAGVLTQRSRKLILSATFPMRLAKACHFLALADINVDPYLPLLGRFQYEAIDVAMVLLRLNLFDALIPNNVRALFLNTQLGVSWNVSRIGQRVAGLQILINSNLLSPKSEHLVLISVACPVSTALVIQFCDSMGCSLSTLLSWQAEFYKHSHALYNLLSRVNIDSTQTLQSIISIEPTSYRNVHGALDQWTPKDSYPSPWQLNFMLENARQARSLYDVMRRLEPIGITNPVIWRALAGDPHYSDYAALAVVQLAGKVEDIKQTIDWALPFAGEPHCYLTLFETLYCLYERDANAGFGEGDSVVAAFKEGMQYVEAPSYCLVKLFQSKELLELLTRDIVRAIFDRAQYAEQIYHACQQLRAKSYNVQSTEKLAVLSLEYLQIILDHPQYAPRLTSAIKHLSLNNCLTDLNLRRILIHPKMALQLARVSVWFDRSKDFSDKEADRFMQDYVADPILSSILDSLFSIAKKSSIDVRGTYIALAYHRDHLEEIDAALKIANNADDIPHGLLLKVMCKYPIAASSFAKAMVTLFHEACNSDMSDNKLMWINDSVYYFASLGTLADDVALGISQFPVELRATALPLLIAHLQSLMPIDERRVFVISLILARSSNKLNLDFFEMLLQKNSSKNFFGLLKQHNINSCLLTSDRQHPELTAAYSSYCQVWRLSKNLVLGERSTSSTRKYMSRRELNEEKVTQKVIDQLPDSVKLPEQIIQNIVEDVFQTYASSPESLHLARFTSGFFRVNEARELDNCESYTMEAGMRRVASFSDLSC